jgi:hypothetical protein
MTKIVMMFGKELDENLVNPSDDIASALRYIAKEIEEGSTSGIEHGGMWIIECE